MNMISRACSTRFRLSRRTLFGLLVILLLAAALPGAVNAFTSDTFHNELLYTGGPDPTLRYYDGHYYLATTTWGDESAGLTMRKAASLAGLSDAPEVQIWQDSTADRCCNMWAPSLHLLDGPNGQRWYMYYSAGPRQCCNDQRMHVLESAGLDPMGPYTYKGELKDSIGGWAIDHSVMMLGTEMYLLFSAWEGDYQNNYIAPMSDPWTLSGDRVLISTPTYAWEMEGGNTNEAPIALHRNGKTFVIYSASSCNGPDYKLGQLTLTGSDPLQTSSWSKKSTPVFQRNDDAGVYGPAHNDFFVSPDGTETWMVYHANDSASEGCSMDRLTLAQKVNWNADDTPNFGVPAPWTTKHALPAGDPGATTHQVVNRHSGKCLEIDGSSIADGGNAVQRTCNGSDNQLWRVDSVGDYNVLRNVHSGKMLEVTNCSRVNGGNIAQWDWLDNNCQRWTLNTTSGAYFELVNLNSGQVAEVDGCSTADGANIHQSRSNSTCQEWELVP